MNVTDATNNIQYSGELIFDENGTISGSLDDAPPINDNLIAGMSIPGAFGVNVNDYSNDKYQNYSPKEVATTFVHELLHQGGVQHPADPENTAPDVMLKKVYKNNYATTTTTDKTNIYFNIMLYSLYNVDGKNVGQIRGGEENATKVSPDQIQVLDENIDTGKINGEAMNDF